jgi:putative membrane protein
MNVIGTVLTFLVGIEHIGICFLKIFGKPEMQAKAFDMDLDFVKQPAARISMANQGIYNGMLGLLLILVYFVFKASIAFTVWQLLLTLIVVVAIFGGFTATKKIFLVQMLPALLALIFVTLQK